MSLPATVTAGSALAPASGRESAWPARRSEYAARGGTSGRHFWWGDDIEPGGDHMMNVFQGTFPGHNALGDGYVGTCPGFRIAR